jgi:4-aminobutyrate--pyruvate transaminase
MAFMTLSNARNRDMQALLHPQTRLKLLDETGPLIIERGQGVFVHDSAGKDYIEGMSGLWGNALGWGVSELADVAAGQMRKLSFGHLFAGKSHEPGIALAEKLKEISPFAVGKVFFGCSGSDANDTQIKFAWYAANARGQAARKKIIARHKACHGATIAAASLTGLESFHTSFDLPLDFARHAEAAHFYRGAKPGESELQYSARLAAGLDDLIQCEGPETIAAMIVEPVMGVGGAIPPPDGYFSAITKVLDKYGIALIDDEVITGFGRTGEWFGCGKYGFEPESMSVAGALSNACLPISAVLLSPEMTEIIDAESRRIGRLDHGYSSGGHPVAAAVALRTLEICQRRDIVGHVRHVAPLFLKKLAGLADHPLVGEARGVGLIAGIEMVADRTGKKSFDPAKGVGRYLARRAQKEGLIVRALSSDRFALCPPLVISEAEIDEMFDRLERALAGTLDWAKSEKLI